MQCPACQRIVYNRRLATCEWCAAPLPEGIRLSDDERQRLDQPAATVALGGDQAAAAQGGVRCPACQRVVFNRRLAACEWCTAALPTGIRMSVEEMSAIDAGEAAKAEQRRQALRQADQESRAKRLKRLGRRAMGLW